AQVPLTLVPSFPIYPPETSWMRYPTSGVPGLVLNESGGGRVAYLAADLDRTFARSRLPDHARMLANLTRWVAGGRIPLAVEGAGFVHCQMYRQGDGLVLHLVNLTGFENGSVPVAEHFPVGPLTVRIEVGEVSEVATPTLRCLVAEQSTEIEVKDGWVEFVIERIVDHEVVVID
ncbi:MAG: hypothetical protein WKF81_06075, partial [Thermomicrobiales bacterium]